MEPSIVFKDLRDFFYVIMREGKFATSVVLYKGCYWKMWYWEHSDFTQILKCEEIVPNAKLVLFNPLAGTFKKATKIDVKQFAQKHYFIVVSPTFVEPLERVSGGKVL